MEKQEIQINDKEDPIFGNEKWWVLGLKSLQDKK